MSDELNTDDFDSGSPDGGAPATDAPVSAPTQDAPHSPAGSANPPDQSGSMQSPWEAFKELPEFQGRTDLDIARDLYASRQGYQEAQRQLAQYQRLVPYAEYGQRYVQNAEAFERWQAEQAKAQAQPAPQPEQPKWWNPPQIDETLKQYIVRDQNGREIIDPNAPVSAQEKLRAFQDYSAQFARKFVTNPEETLRPFVETEAKRIAAEIVQEQLRQRETQSFVQSLEQKHADWLYDAPGVPSREGIAMQQYIEEGKQIGISDPHKLWDYASRQLRADFQAVRYQQLMQGGGQPMALAAPQPPAVPAAPAISADVQFLRDRATRKPNRSAGAGEPRAPRGKQTFEEMLSKQLVADGAI